MANGADIAKFLKLDKPLVIFDLETTGPAISIDRIVEIAFLKIMPNGRTRNGDLFLNPEMEISSESVEIHGIRDDDVAGKPTFREKASELWDVFYNCYYGGFNIINFDLPLLRREFVRVGMDFNYSYDQIIDSKLILRYMEPRTLSHAYKYYVKKNCPSDHTALTHVMNTAEILEKQLIQYEPVKDWKFVNKIHHPYDEDKVYSNSTRRIYWKKGKAFFDFSKYKDKPLSEVAKKDPEFMQWILGADFSDDLKHIVSKELSSLKKKSRNP